MGVDELRASAMDELVEKTFTMRVMIDELCDGWKERYAARCAIITALTSRNATREELREAFRQLL